MKRGAAIAGVLCAAPLVSLNGQLVSGLAEQGCLLEQQDGAPAWNTDRGRADECRNPPFDLPPSPLDSTLTRKR